jgi:hypothetical protein
LVENPQLPQDAWSTEYKIVPFVGGSSDTAVMSVVQDRQVSMFGI